MADPASFAKLVPGFDFLQGLMKNAGSGLPAMSQWIAPTLDPEELDKRIGELRTVQFWLEQNAKMIATTIQALEVQRMTLATLQTMNLPMADVRESMKVRPAAPTPPAAAPAPAPARKAASRKPAAGASASAPSGAGPVDPMQWWGALTQQFGELAAQALKDVPASLGGAAPGPEKEATPAPKPARAPAPRRRSR